MHADAPTPLRLAADQPCWRLMLLGNREHRTAGLNRTDTPEPKQAVVLVVWNVGEAKG
jgi:hypothetical protein